MARWKVDIWTTDWAFEWWINSVPKGQRSCRGRSQKNIQGRWGWEGIIKIWQYFKGWTKRKNSDVDASYYFFLQWFLLFYLLSSLSVSSLFLWHTYTHICSLLLFHSLLLSIYLSPLFSISVSLSLFLPLYLPVFPSSLTLSFFLPVSLSLPFSLSPTLSHISHSFMIVGIQRS